MKYRATFEFEAGTPEEAAQRVLASLYVGDIDADNVKVEQVDGGEVFSFPLVQSLVRQLNEIRRPASAESPAAEGDWVLYNRGEAGGDI